jgi:menaquinone-dependent protoporphyrinogen IX oxidase
MYRRDFCKFGLAGVGTFAFSKSVNALNYITTASQKKNAVLYFSWCGSTKDAAKWIAEGMGGTANVDVLDIKGSPIPNLSNYESIVIGSAVRSMAISPDMKTYIQKNKTALGNKIKGFFAVCGNNSSTTIDDATKKKYTNDQLASYAGVSNVPGKVFPGRVDQCAKDAGINITPYDHLSQADCVAFGKTLLPTMVKSIRNDIPTNFELRQNYPNPFNPVTNISYSLPQTCNVLLTVSAVNGRKLATIVSGHQEAGYHNVIWDGRQLPPGRYLYRLQAGSFSATREARLIH